MIRATDIADFYQQLALLIKSNLPLPDSLVRLAKQFPRRKMAQIVERLGEETARGRTFSQVLKEHADVFPPFHSQLLAAGETTGTLPVMLFTVARFARVQHFLVSRLREVFAYPLLTIHVACLVLGFLSVRVIPFYVNIYSDMYGGDYLPWLTRIVFGMGLLISNNIGVFGALYLAFVVLSAVIFLPTHRCKRGLLHIVAVMPGTRRLLHELDAARLCSLWSSFVAQAMPSVDILRASSRLVAAPTLRTSLERAADAVAAGRGVADALDNETAVDGLIVMTLEHADEQDLADELLKLAELYENRVAMGVRWATQAWTIIALVSMIVTVGIVVVSLFLPLIQFVRYIG